MNKIMYTKKATFFIIFNSILKLFICIFVLIIIGAIIANITNEIINDRNAINTNAIVLDTLTKSTIQINNPKDNYFMFSNIVKIDTINKARKMLTNDFQSTAINGKAKVIDISNITKEIILQERPYIIFSRKE